MVTFLGDRCQYNGPPEIAPDDVVVIDFVNESDRIAGIGTFVVFEETTLDVIKNRL